MSTTPPPRSKTATLEGELNSAIGAVRALASEIEPELAEQVVAAVASAQGQDQAVVVVVGEVKQGKSSLVNALVGRPGLSPVDVAVATATFLVIGNGTPEGATVHRFGNDPTFEVGLDDIGRWARPSAEEAIRNLDVRVDAPHMGQLVLVDTPGVGGITAQHAKTALDGAEKALALLFVTDAQTPLTDVELDFLAKASERVNTVLFALTKIGVNKGWREVLAENQENLAKVAPRFADALWVATDARMALNAIDDLGCHPVAADSEDPANADALSDWEESGVKELLEALTVKLAPRAQLMATANAVRFSRTALDRMSSMVVGQQAGLSNDPELLASVEQERLRLKGLGNEQRTWGLTLERHLSTLRIDTTAELNQRITTCRAAWISRLRGQRRAPKEFEIEQMLLELRAEVDAIASDVLALTKARFRNVADALFKDLVDESNVPLALDALSSRVELTTPQNMPAGRAFGAQDSMDLYYGMSLGQGAGGMLSKGLGGLGVVVAATNPVLLVLITAAGIGAKLYLRKDAMRSSDFQQTILNWLSEASGLIRNEIDRNTTDAKYLLSEAFRTTLEARVNEVQKIIATSEAAARADEATLSAQRKGLSTQANRIGTSMSKLDQLLARPELQALPAPSRPSLGAGDA